MSSPTRKFRLAAVTSHPVQYQAPLFQRLALCPEIDLTVYYGHDGSVIGDVDAEFGVPVKWDRPLLAGYRSVFLTRRSSDNSRWSDARRKATIIEHLAQGNYDAVFVHSYATWLSGMAFLGAWKSRIPVLLRTESHRLKARPALTEAVKNVVLRTLFRYTSAFLVIGEANKRFYAHYRVDDRRMFWTPYCVDNDFFISERQRLATQRDAIRRELGLREDSAVVVYSGKLIDLKRVEDLLSAASILSRQGRSVQVLIVGDGPCRSALMEQAKALGLSAIFVGFQNQTKLSRHYLCGDVFVLPSERETWGLVLNEAMLFEMPIVTTVGVGASLDLVEQGVTGYTYDIGNHEMLAGRLSEILGCSCGRQRLGAAARARVDRFNYDQCVKGILSALEFTSADASHA